MHKVTGSKNLIHLIKINNAKKIFRNVDVRLLATINEIFPNKTDFPARHIGPRKTDVVSMLDLLGYKVKFILIYFYLFLFYINQWNTIF